jgi:hypothetical protein
MFVEVLVHFDSSDTRSTNGFTVVASSQREGLFPFSMGFDDVLGDSCALVVDCSATKKSGMPGPLPEALHCNTSVQRP